jgi:hypothetical protein
MKKSLFPALATLLASALLSGLASHPARAEAVCQVEAEQSVAIPSYFYPGELWQRLESAAPTVGLAIINPDNGPGRRRDAEYAAEVERARSQGIWVLGYVYTLQGARAFANKVKKDIDRYYDWYGVDGIFVDEAPGTDECVKKGYYKTIYQYIKAKGGTAKVVLNPGTQTNECYMEVSDILINFEDEYAQYLDWQPSGWERKYPADRFWHLVHSTAQADMPNAVGLAKQRHAGWVYVTPDVMDNPWDSLPPEDYWAKLLGQVGQ